ncbi:hypothetical protein [Flavobacterium davisii]|uniref:hypothetical protein n=1 Tax=Flavobacterium davisii TaxID=2906077 RepID=UPI0035CF3BDC
MDISNLKNSIICLFILISCKNSHNCEKQTIDINNLFYLTTRIQPKSNEYKVYLKKDSKIIIGKVITQRTNKDYENIILKFKKNLNVKRNDSLFLEINKKTHIVSDIEFLEVETTNGSSNPCLLSYKLDGNKKSGKEIEL